MQAASPGKVQSAINVTPLVDVVLVLLIIFMIVAPQMAQGPDLDLPTTEQAPQKPDDGRQIVVAIDRGGTIWVESDAVQADAFQAAMMKVAEERSDWQVVIKGDSHLTFGEVKNAMLAVETAGFKNVGLITQRRDEQAQGR